MDTYEVPPPWISAYLLLLVSPMGCSSSPLNLLPFCNNIFFVLSMGFNSSILCLPYFPQLGMAVAAFNSKSRGIIVIKALIITTENKFEISLHPVICWGEHFETDLRHFLCCLSLPNADILPPPLPTTVSVFSVVNSDHSLSSSHNIFPLLVERYPKRSSPGQAGAIIEFGCVFFKFYVELLENLPNIK